MDDRGAMATGDASEIAATLHPGTFTQYIADNIDHNLHALDRKETFYGMCIIQTSTNKVGLQIETKVIKRQLLQHVDEVTKKTGDLSSTVH